MREKLISNDATIYFYDNHTVYVRCGDLLESNHNHRITFARGSINCPKSFQIMDHGKIVYRSDHCSGLPYFIKD
jgi:hypothetical protein